MSAGYEHEMPKDMPAEAYAGLSVAHLHEWFLKRQAEESQADTPAEANDKEDGSEDPNQPAA